MLTLVTGVEWPHWRRSPKERGVAQEVIPTLGREFELSSRRHRFLSLTACVAVVFLNFLSPSTKLGPPVSTVWAAGNWNGASAAGSGAAPWDTFAAGVNVVNGNLMVSGEGPSLPGINGFDEVVSPVYNSISVSKSNGMGRGWLMGTGSGVGLDLNHSGSVTFYDASGHGYAFSHPSSCSFTAPAGIDATLACGVGPANYTLTFHASGLQYQFNSYGFLGTVLNREGNQIQFSYDIGGHLTKIVNTEGQATNLGYDGSGRLTQITDPAGRVWSYTVGADLTQIMDPAGNKTSLSYNLTSGLMTQITSPDGKVTSISYDSSHRVHLITENRTIPRRQPGSLLTARPQRS